MKTEIDKIKSVLNAILDIMGENLNLTVWAKWEKEKLNED